MTDMDFSLWSALPANVVNVTGAGDSLAGGVMWGVCQGWPMHKCVKAGLSAAKLSVEARTAISTALTPDAVNALIATIADQGGDAEDAAPPPS